MAIQANNDGDGQGDLCDADDDNDGVQDGGDNCQFVANASQADFDGDLMGDACDPDDDGDGQADTVDLCPGTPAATVVDPASGCSVAQPCPCFGPRGTTTAWKTHGQYVSCVAKSSERLLELGLISEQIKGTLCSAAGQSTCGCNAGKSCGSK